ncbi:unnamed protein product [Calicophoron daubneyi]|uniref:Uncharacterized protein n=1 Tax=Calicophoron daubneyi TaxID=300641 RepID=A0AAV2TQS1_CALDB
MRASRSLLARPVGVDVFALRMLVKMNWIWDKDYNDKASVKFKLAESKIRKLVLQVFKYNNRTIGIYNVSVTDLHEGSVNAEFLILLNKDGYNAASMSLTQVNLDFNKYIASTSNSELFQVLRVGNKGVNIFGTKTIFLCIMIERLFRWL